MQAIMLWSQAHPRRCLVFLLLCSLAASLKLGSVRIDTSIEGMTVRNDPARSYYYETLDRFGSDSMAVVFIQDGELFTPDKLSRLQSLAYALEDVESVARVESLFSASNLRNEDGALISGLLIDGVPGTLEEAHRIRQRALSNEILEGNLISADGTATAINLYLETLHDHPTLMISVSDAVEEILLAHEAHFGVLFQVGRPFSVRTQAGVVSTDQRVLFPIAFVSLLLVLGLTMRSASGVVLPALTGGLSVLWTLGFMGYTGIPLTVLTFVVPALVTVVGSTEDIHILAEFMSATRGGATREQAVRQMASEVGTALLFTATTTFLGFLSIALNNVTVVRQFGIVAAFGMLANAVITFLLAPIYLHHFGPRHAAGHGGCVVDRVLSALARGIVRVVHSRGTLTVAAFVVAALGIGLCGIGLEVENNPLTLFRENAVLPTRIRALNNSLSGSASFYIRIHGEEGDFRQPANLAAVEALKRYLVEETGFDKALSFTDHLKLIHREMMGGGAEHFKVPDSEREIAEYLLFLHRGEIQRYVTPEFDELNIVVRHNIYSSRVLSDKLEQVRVKAREVLPARMEVGITGQMILVNKAVKEIVRGQVLGMAAVAAVLLVLMSVLFGGLKAGLLSLVPNLLPVSMIFGIMALLDVPLNTATCMVAPIALGIAMDDTIHVMVRYGRTMRVVHDESHAVGMCICSEIRPVLCTSLALSLGFGLLGFSRLVPIACFGLLSALIMAIAAISDLLVTPVLLKNARLKCWARRRGPGSLPALGLIILLASTPALAQDSSDLLGELEGNLESGREGAGVASGLLANLGGRTRLRTLYLQHPETLPVGTAEDAEHAVAEALVELATWTGNSRWRFGVSGWVEAGTQEDMWTSGMDWPQDTELNRRHIEINEIYVMCYRDAFDFTIGKKILHNGVAPLYSPADRYGRRDYSVSSDIRELGVWLAQSDVYLGDVTLTGAVLPIHQPSKGPAVGRRPAAVVSPFVAMPGGTALGPMEIEEEPPDIEMDSVGYLLRAKAVRPGWDLFVSIYDGLSPFYVAQRVPGGTEALGLTGGGRLRLENVRTADLAAGFAATRTAWGFHGEAVYSRPRGRRDDEFVSYVTGVTYRIDPPPLRALPNQVFLIAEYAGEETVAQQSAPDYVAGSETVRAGRNDCILRCHLELNDRMTCRFTGAVELDNGSWCSQVEAQYRLRGGLLLLASLDAFGGSEHGWYGRLNGYDAVAASLQYSF